MTIRPAPHCKSTNITRKADSDRVGRWNCHACKSSFNVLSGTVFQKTRIPLQKWLLAIGLMVNAKKSLSSCQLARDLQVSQPAAWYMQQRIRVAMVASERELLQGIIEMDETYLGSGPIKGYHGACDESQLADATRRAIMSEHHFWLADDPFDRLKPLLPNKGRGVPRGDDRKAISGISHVIR